MAQSREGAREVVIVVIIHVVKWHIIQPGCPNSRDTPELFVNVSCLIASSLVQGQSE